MLTILRIDGYPFFFYSNENTEPPHVHVERGDECAKFWLDPVRLAWNRGYNRSEIGFLYGAIGAQQAYLLGRWHAFFP